MVPIQRRVLQEITRITTSLIEGGFADDQNFPIEVGQRKGTVTIQFSSIQGFGSLLRDIPYEDIYKELRMARSYNILMLDGAMIQMLYEFRKNTLVRHRLAFLPSPDLLSFQNEPELYLDEVLYADVVKRNVVTIPLRFDYDNRTGVAKSLLHPKSHLTLGQYQACRIPVTSGVTPHNFVDFLLRSFYRLATSATSLSLPQPVASFRKCITSEERDVAHICLPS